jgi:hypothetical protein
MAVKIQETENLHTKLTGPCLHTSFGDVDAFGLLHFKYLITLYGYFKEAG